MEITIGITHENSAVVTEEMTAAAMKSGLVRVLATPILVALVENNCMECVAPMLPEGQTTVGTSVNVSHCAATPVDMKVRFECELVEIDRRRLVFKVAAFDEREKISEGTHERFIVDMEKFMQKTLAK